MSPTFPTRHLLRAAAIGLALAAASIATAQTWSEAGDAGETPATAQVTSGSGPLTQINGSLQSDPDVDMFCVDVTNPAAFSASVQCVMAADPSIWIFTPSGAGIVLNDVCMFSGKTVPAGWVGAGTCYIAVTQLSRQPQSTGGAMWLSQLFTGPRAPDGPGAAGNLWYWAGGGPLPGVTPYTINLTGATFCQAAVPAEAHDWGTLKATYR